MRKLITKKIPISEEEKRQRVEDYNYFENANINVEEKKGETDDKSKTENKKENTKESNKLIIVVPVIIIIIVVGIILFLKFKKVNEVD